MPSSKFIELELGASGAKYTAPANGWFVLSIRSSSASNGEVHLSCVETGVGFQANNYGAANAECKGFAPVLSGQQVICYYNNVQTAPQIFRFIYTLGNQ